MPYKDYVVELQEVAPVGPTELKVFGACNKAHALTLASGFTNTLGRLVMIKKVRPKNSSDTKKERELIQQLSITDAQKALNKANLVDEKLKVVEARLTTYHTDFNRIVDNHVDRIKADIRNN